MAAEANSQTTAPNRPARNPTRAPATRLNGLTPLSCARYAATAPPPTIQRQQQLAILTIGSADSTPIKRPPSRTACVIPRPRSGCPRAHAEGSIVVLASEMGDELLALHMPQRVLQLHELNKQVVLGIHLTRVHRRLEVERQP